MQIEEAIAMDAYNGEGNDADAVLAGADQLMQRGQQDDDVVHERHGYGQGFADFDFQGDRFGGSKLNPLQVIGFLLQNVLAFPKPETQSNWRVQVGVRFTPCWDSKFGAIPIGVTCFGRLQAGAKNVILYWNSSSMRTIPFDLGPTSGIVNGDGYF